MRNPSLNSVYIWAKPQEIKKAKLKMGITNYTLSRLLYCSEHSLSRICTCWETTSKQMADNICKELEVEFDDIFEIRIEKALVTLDLEEIDEVCYALKDSELVAKFIKARERIV